MQTIKSVPTIQVKKIDRVLKKAAKQERLTAYSLCNFSADSTRKKCKSVGACAIGALLLAAGMPASAFLVDDVNEHSLYSAAGRLLRDEYGILPVHTGSIESINDSALQTERYEDVVSFVGFLQWQQENGVRFALGDSATNPAGIYRDGFRDIPE
jgi:hypothetical protein